jgi:chemotaxis protein MotB
MARKKGGGHAGGHGWFVTFADLMGLLMSFFVMLVAFSTQDANKLRIVAGSMRDAFGTVTDSRLAGIIEKDGLPENSHIKNTMMIDPSKSSDHAAADPNDNKEGLDTVANNRSFALAVASLRQAIADMPEIAELSKNIILEETKDGLDIALTDQTGRAMFPDGSVEPYDHVARALERLVPALRKMSNRILITGHTASVPKGAPPDPKAWDVSVGRAAAVRNLLANAGLPDDRFAGIQGKGDSEPLFPDNPQLPANRRVNILLLKEAPPLPFGKKL